MIFVPSNGQEVDDLTKAIIEESSVKDLDLSCFTGEYVTGNVTEDYLSWVEREYLS